MTHSLKTRLLALVLSLAMAAALMPAMTFAGEPEQSITMTEGEIQYGLAQEGAACTSSDPAIAWVDEAGNLRAMKPGTVEITVSGEEGESVYEVTVSDYSDGSPIVGSLKIQARYNDSMEFYDGHICLLFTSYQDGVEINVDGIYGAYEISDQYYRDIRQSIANGSNHTGSDAAPYFTFVGQQDQITLDRGEIVTIGMYRDFDLTVPQAALGSIQNSSAWEDIVAAGKTGVVETLFRMLSEGKADTDETFAGLMKVLAEIGVDSSKLFDGVVSGGVCYNRELYNQKLEWDQYENVTYEMDITENQLKTLQMYLGGNLNKFSIIKNSCATVAVRAWNGTVGTRNGEDTAYKLTAAGEGIFSVLDAPKGVRDSIVAALPGYYLNNAQGVAEPDAGYEDETGWVYVIAPEKVSPLSFTYAEDSLKFDEDKCNPSSLLKDAAAGGIPTYNKEAQEIPVSFTLTPGEDGLTTLEAVSFDVNGNKLTAGESTAVSEPFWVKVPVSGAGEGSYAYVLDENGLDIAHSLKDGWLSFEAAGLPLSYKIVTDAEADRNALSISSSYPQDALTVTEVYTGSGEEKTPVEGGSYLASGTKVCVRAEVSEEDTATVLMDITLNGESILDEDHFDGAEGAYTFNMPACASELDIVFDEIEVTARDGSLIQTGVGETLDVSDYAQATGVLEGKDYGKLQWRIVTDEDGILEMAEASGDQKVNVKAEGKAVLWAFPAGRENVGVMFMVEAFEDIENTCRVTWNVEGSGSLLLSVSPVYPDSYTGEVETTILTASGCRVRKGMVLTIDFDQEESVVPYTFTINGEDGLDRRTIELEGDVDIQVSFKQAVITGVPGAIRLTEKGDSAQLYGRVQYLGFPDRFLTPKTGVEYTCDSSLIEVDESGRITVTGDIPEEGAAAVVTASASYSNGKVSALCAVRLGAFEGDEIVGNLTIHVRNINSDEPVPHGAVTFTTYQDIDLDASYYHYYKPTEAYTALMEDYRDHPEKYTSDPALYSGNELGLENRESYFEEIHHGAGSEPSTVSLRAGESISISNYSYDGTHFEVAMRALEGSTLSKSESTAVLLEQVKKYYAGEAIDGPLTFDSMLSTIGGMCMYAWTTGVNPVDGHSEGGMDINREMYNEFRRNDLQTPNYYYTVEITADELAFLKQFLANPENNYYSILTKNCGGGAVDIWNAALADRQDLNLAANYSGLFKEPVSLYYELQQMVGREELDGEGGTDFYPRTVAYAVTKPVESVTLNMKEKALNVGLTVQLTAKVLPADADDAEITWTSSNQKVAAVSAGGLVTALRCGSSIITASTANGTFARCRIKVKQRYVYQLEKNGVYRYSTSTKMIKSLAAEGWTYKKVFRAAGKSDTPVYWIYNKTTKRYMYTTNRAKAVKMKAAGCKAGRAFYASDKKVKPVYELCLEGKRPTYFYTMKRKEARTMMAKGYTYKGIAWYSEPKAA